MAYKGLVWLGLVSFLAALTLTALVAQPALSAESQAIKVLGDSNIPYVSYLVDKAATQINTTHPGLKIEYLPALDINQAMLRTVIGNDHNDVLVLSFDSFVAYHKSGFLAPLDKYVPADIAQLVRFLPEETLIWGQVDARPYCLYLSGTALVPINKRLTEQHMPSFVCLSTQSQHPDQAWEAIKAIALQNKAVDSIDYLVDVFIRKFFREHDFRTIYRYFVDSDRRSEYTGISSDWTEESFVEHANWLIRSFGPGYRLYPDTWHPRLAPGALPNYCGDPLKRSNYPEKDVRQYWYRLEERALRRDTDITYLTISLHILPTMPYRTVRLFFSTQNDFDRFFYSDWDCD